MPTLKIDNKEYAFDTLADDCKAQLASIQFVEQELVRLQAKAPSFKGIQPMLSAWIWGFTSCSPSFTLCYSQNLQCFQN